MTPLLALHDLVKHYQLPRESLWRPPAVVEALRGVSLQLSAGESLGIVGESGSGKSTLARLVMALEAPTSGRVVMDGIDLQTLSAAALREARRHFQMVFQDPYGSLDPRQRIADTVAEPLLSFEPHLSKSQRRDRAAQMLQAVGLGAETGGKYPHEFSGGQRQRIAIARALVSQPKLIVADEPVSALDVSVQAQVLNLMMDLRAQFGVSYLLISHDLAVVRHVCDRVAVIQSGVVVEQGPIDAVFERPEHPFTQTLLAAAS
jgi:ABC-type glutathione transport system ATPase component